MSKIKWNRSSIKYLIFKQESNLAFFIVIILFFSPDLLAQKIHRDSIESGRQVIEDLISRNQIPGLSISVSIDGELIWSEGFGFADLEQKVPVYSNKTKFRIGSVSKPLTATAVAKLYEEGKINLDLAIQNYVPDFPLKKDSITLRMLAGHLAGIRHYRNKEFLSDKHYETVGGGLEIFKNDSLINVPGTEYSYSSYGWNLISVAVEQAANEPFLDYMKHKVFDQMEMYQTFADQKYEIIPFRTRFYDINSKDKKVQHAPSVDNSYKWAGGGFISTSEDLVKFGNALLNHRFIKSETLRELITSQRTSDGELTNYGIGFESGTDQNKKYWFGHSGGSIGGITQFRVYPNQKLVIAIVTNSSNVNYGDTLNQLIGLFTK